tara:strand:+ start:19469 stop:20845 length:1377 start_codon:yes stop_codon:yes gene_type:complete
MNKFPQVRIPDEIAASAGPSQDISARFLNAELMVDEPTARWFETLAASSAKIIKPQMTDMQAEEMFYDFGAVLNREDRKPYIVDDGVAIINIKGVLEHDSRWYHTYWTGYDAIRMRFDMALKDPEVRGIVFMVNTPGGEVAGNFDLADHIYSQRGKKPMISVVNESAYSAGYSLASAADKIIVNRTGGVGSIGVITIHFDRSKWMDDVGIKPTIIHAGKFKKDGNPYENLSAESAARIQTRIDGLYTIFVDTVARNRGIKSDAVRDTQAATYSGEQAVGIGLADSVKSSVAALAEFKQELSGSTFIGGISMSSGNQEGAATLSTEGPQNNAATGYTQAHLDAQVTAATATGVKQENERIMAILSCDEAKDRQASATTLAKNSQMSLEVAKELLADLPTSTPAAAAPGADALGTAMAASGGGAGVGAGDGVVVGEEQATVIDSAKIYAAINNPAKPSHH